MPSRFLGFAHKGDKAVGLKAHQESPEMAAPDVGYLSGNPSPTSSSHASLSTPTAQAMPGGYLRGCGCG